VWGQILLTDTSIIHHLQVYTISYNGRIIYQLLMITKKPQNIRFIEVQHLSAVRNKSDRNCSYDFIKAATALGVGPQQIRVVSSAY